MDGTTTQPYGALDPAFDHRELPEPVRLEDTFTSQDAVEAPDPAMGRDSETEWLLRTAAG